MPPPVFPRKVDDESIASRSADRAAYVAGHVHTENAREHADSDQPDTLRQLRRGDDLIGHDDRSLFFFGSRNRQCGLDDGAVGPTNGERIRLA